MADKRRSDIYALSVLVSAGAVWFVIRLYGGASLDIDIQGIFVYLLIAPVAEELFFRGVVHDYINSELKKRDRKYIVLKKPVLTRGNILTSVIFAAVHIPLWGVVHSVLVFFPSLAFGFIYDKTGKIVYPVFLHAVYNINVFIV